MRSELELESDFIPVIIIYYWQDCTLVEKMNYYFTPDLPGNKLTLDDLGLLLEELVDVCDRWYDLGLQLGVRPETLNALSPQFHSSLGFFLEVIKTWLTTNDNPSWKTLTDALRSRSVGANQLAGSLERKYCLTKEMRESKH